MSDTPLLGLPLLAAAQAQKHITHNEALLLLDAAIQLSVISRSIADPPASAMEGDRHLVAASPTGNWAGQQGRIALAQGGGWVFLTPRKGWRMWVEGEAKLLVFDGTEWRDPVTGFTRLGINATADDNNRLAVASPASLFNHAGNDHRLKVNKNAAGDVASVLYQTGFSGRAELGLAGSDDFRIAVSSDGASWRPALTIDRMSGAVTLPNTPVAPAMLFNQSLAGQGPGFATDSYLAGSAIALPAARLKAGTRYVLSFDVTKTSSGIGAPVITLRLGGTGSAGDPGIAAVTLPAQTASSDDGRLAVEVTFRSTGAGTAAVVQMIASLTHTLSSSGLATSPSPVRRATSAGFDSSLQNQFLGISVNGGALAAWSVSLVQARLENLQ